MRDGDGGAALRGGVECVLDDTFRGGIECGGGFIEEEDLWVAEEGAGDCYALALAAGEEGAFGADKGVEAIW